MSARRNIAGTLGLAELALLTDAPRSRDSASQAAEIRRLHRSGHSAQFIASRLRMDIAAVRETLQQPSQPSRS
jgi:hypothetical protein